MQQKDQNPPPNIWYSREYPVLSRILVFLDKFFLDFRRNGYREVSLPSYTVQSSDYENMKIVRAVKKYYWSGEIRMHYGAMGRMWGQYI